MRRPHVVVDLMLAIAIAAVVSSVRAVGTEVPTVAARDAGARVPEPLSALLPPGVSIDYADEGKIVGTSVSLKGVANFTDALRKSDRYRNAAPRGLTREGTAVHFEFALFPPTDGILSLSRDKAGVFGTARDAQAVASFVEALRSTAEHKDAKLLFLKQEGEVLTFVVQM